MEKRDSVRCLLDNQRKCWKQVYDSVNRKTYKCSFILANDKSQCKERDCLH